MDSQLTNKGAYVTSDNLKNADGTPFAYGNYTFQTPSGANVKVTAIRANNQTLLSPSRQLKDGSWDSNYQTFSSPEEVILHFRSEKPNK